MEIIEEADETLVLLDGRFDSERVASVRACWEILSERHADICIDLSKATFIDSAALGSIAFLFKRLTIQGRRLRIVGATGQPKEFLEALRIAQVIEVLPARTKTPNEGAVSGRATDIGIELQAGGGV